MTDNEWATKALADCIRRCMAMAVAEHLRRALELRK